MSVFEKVFANRSHLSYRVYLCWYKLVYYSLYLRCLLYILEYCLVHLGYCLYILEYYFCYWLNKLGHYFVVKILERKHGPAKLLPLNRGWKGKEAIQDFLFC